MAVRLAGLIILLVALGVIVVLDLVGQARGGHPRPNLDEPGKSTGNPS